MSSGIELKLGVINQLDWLLHLIIFSQVYVN